MEAGLALAPLATLEIFAALTLSASGVVLDQADAVRRRVVRITAAARGIVDNIVVNTLEDRVLPPLINVGASAPSLLRRHNT